MFTLLANIFGYWWHMGDYSSAKKLSFSDIKKLYEVPIMPYIKFSVEKYFKIKDKIDLITGAILTYNFGMFYEEDTLLMSKYAIASFSYKSYKFYSLSIDVFIAFGFGRPK